MSLSIIIPYFKPNFLQRCLKSLEQQSNKNFQIFIFDDASPDDPGGIIDPYKVVLEITYHRFEENVGSRSLAAHWNRCIDRLPYSEWVQILGDDDFLDRNCIEDFFHNLKEINEHNANIIRFSSVTVDANNYMLSRIHDHPSIENSTDFIFNKIQGKSRSSLSEHIFRTQIVKEKKFKHFPLAWHSDDLALLEFSDFGNIFSINSSKVFVRYSNVSISGKKDLSKRKNVASFLFYSYLVRYYPEQLSQDQKEILYRKFEKCVLNEKRNISLFFQVSKWYLQDLSFKKYLRFVIAYSRETVRIIKTSPYKT